MDLNPDLAEQNDNPPISARLAAVEAKANELEIQQDGLRRRVSDLEEGQSVPGSLNLDAGPLHVKGPGRWVSLTLVTLTLFLAIAKGKLQWLFDWISK